MSTSNIHEFSTTLHTSNLRFVKVVASAPPPALPLMLDVASSSPLYVATERRDQHGVVRYDHAKHAEAQVRGEIKALLGEG